MKQDKEQWKDTILNSLEGLQKAEPNPFLFTRIQEKISQNGVIEDLSFLPIKAMVATVCLLLFVNVGAVVHSYKTTIQTSMEADEYLIPTYNFYDYE